MASLEPVDIDPADRDEIREEDNEWGNDLMTDLERRFEKLRQFNRRLETFPDKDVGDIMLEKRKVKEDTIELVANQIYDRITKLINYRRERLGMKGGAKIVEPLRNYDSFDLDDNGNLNFKYGKEDIYIGNINEGLNSPSKMIKKLGVNRLRLMSFSNITDEGIYPGLQS